MTPPSPPPVDVRTADDMVRRVRELLATMPGWTERAPLRGPAAGLIHTFGRYAELVLERVNRVPDRTC